MLSDQEVVDLTRNAPNPKVAADRILSFSEGLGGADNGTVMVVPLKGWGKTQGPDKTKELREYRRGQSGMFSYDPRSYSFSLIEFTRGKRAPTTDVTAYNVL